MSYDGFRSVSSETPKVIVEVSRARRVVLWLIFVGLVAVASTLVTALIAYLGGNTPNFTAILTEGGDGFLIVIAITADAFGRAVERRQAHTLPAIGCGIALMGALIGFGFTKTQLQNHNEEVESTIQTIQSIEPKEGLRRLKEVLGKHPYKGERIMAVTSVLVLTGLLSSFVVIIRLEDE